MKRFIYQTRSSAFLVACMLVVVCTHQSCDQSSPADEPADTRRGVSELYRKLPKIRFVDSRLPAGKASAGDARTSDFSTPGSFDFSDDPEGVSFSSSANISYEEGPDGGVLVVDINSLGNGGGTVYAGSNTYPVGIAFCFSTDDPFEIIEVEEVPGLSAVVGLVGLDDLDLENVDADAVEAYLEAIIYYIVFDDQAEGEYDVAVDENIDQDDGTAVIFDLKRGVIYGASRGKLVVNANSMSFDGFYEEIPLEISLDDEEDQVSNEVPGSGEMGCL